MNLHEQICEWENLRRAYANASRGKRGRGATALFESLLADNLLELEQELREQTYQPGKYSNFYIHEPKKRLISAAPFLLPSPFGRGAGGEGRANIKMPAAWIRSRRGQILPTLPI